LRKRQIKNFAAILMLSQGVPMFVVGDEIRRTQKGNNNAYCQDNEINWFDWNLAEKNRDMFRFFKQMIAFRKSHPSLRRSRFFTGQVNQRRFLDMAWHGCRLNSPGWNDPSSRVLAFTLGGFSEGDSSEDVDIHVMLNMEWEDLDFDVPPLAERKWYKVVDTFQSSPNDIAENIAELGEAAVVSENVCHVKNRSVVVLISR
jgi:isoamylase